MASGWLKRWRLIGLDQCQPPPVEPIGGDGVQQRLWISLAAHSIGEVCAWVDLQVLVDAHLRIRKDLAKLAADRGREIAWNKHILDVQRAQDRALWAQQPRATQQPIGNILDLRAEQVIGVAARLERIEPIDILDAIHHAPADRQRFLRGTIIQVVPRQDCHFAKGC